MSTPSSQSRTDKAVALYAAPIPLSLLRIRSLLAACAALFAHTECGAAHDNGFDALLLVEDTQHKFVELGADPELEQFSIYFHAGASIAGALSLLKNTNGAPGGAVSNELQFVIQLLEVAAAEIGHLNGVGIDSLH